ncbi:nucleoside-diphosphate kinase [Burkholderia sp. TSV86]|uniref:nucleoside-diphosphate kinase n=1 Tax=Burkholderia sp. TSV86 TaxID=1385594 RepID=UPI0018D24ACB|nr:nucleoside-diphosphate kinase [Burkholderia sp. TSV86]
MPSTESAINQIPKELIGSGYICNTPALATTWQLLQEEVPVNLHSEVANSCFVLLKPDILASRKEESLWERLLEAGTQPLIAWVCLHSGLREFEELYKFNLTLHNEQCMLSSWWLHNLPYQMGPVICLLIRVPTEVRREVTASDFIAKLKGPSNPFLATNGHWRHDMVSTNMALNLVHSSDDPISSIWEFRIFGSSEFLKRALERSHALNVGTASEEVVVTTVHNEFRIAVDLAGYPHHDLDLVSNLIRLKLRLVEAIAPNVWISDELTKGYRELLRGTGTAGERWHRYKSLCEIEQQRYRQVSCPEILSELAKTATYRPELSDILAAEMRRHRLPYSDWERIVIETTFFFHKHLPS